MISAAATLSNEEIVERLDRAFRQKAAAEGTIVDLLGEAGRRQVYRDDGATSPEPWAVERFGVSIPTARALTHVGEKAWDLPHLVESLCAGDLSFDKVRAVADVATPETDRELCEQAKEHSVRELADIARSRRRTQGTLEQDRRFLRFNEPAPHHERPDARRVLRRDPEPASRPGPARSPPTARPLGTSASVTPSWS